MEVREWLDSDLGVDIWEKKYCFNGESFDEWLDRVSNNDSELRQLITDKKFLFGGRILSNRGLQKTGKKITYSNCYVVEPPEDSIESIFNCASKLARTFSYGGGCGVDISKLAPRGAKVNNTAKETSGAVSFMELYSMITGLIGQNGRRGALMISIDCNHPDLEEFIEIKSDLDKVTKANISIRITNEFLEAVKNEQEYNLEFIRQETGEKIIKKINARDLFQKFAQMNWDYAEPALLYWDRIENWNLLSNTKEFKFAGTNPCAEEPLPAGGSCLLGSINLAEFVTENKKFNFVDFRKTVQIAVKALNDVLDEGLPLHPLQEQRDNVRDWRQIGLGIFGLADMLIKMEIEYGSSESIKICKYIAEDMINYAVEASAYLAKEYGTYPKYKYDDVCTTDFYNTALYRGTKQIVKECGLRNSQLLTIAPTGTLSTMLGVSGGIEPIFANYYERKTESLHDKEVTYKVYTPIVDKYIKDNNIKDDKDLPLYFITTQNLNYKNRIDMQSVWQECIDASISSTVNVPNDFTVDEVKDLYLYAYEKGLKGVTIFRDGCKRLGILTTNNSSEEIDDDCILEPTQVLKRGDILCVSDDLLSFKRTVINGCGKFYIHCDFDEYTGEPLETFIEVGSGGGCERNLQLISRLISLLLRAGIPVEEVIDQAQSIRPCKSYTDRTKSKGDTSRGTSCPSAIGYALTELQEKIHNRCFNDDIDLLNKSSQISEPENSFDRCTGCGTPCFGDEILNVTENINNPCPICGVELSFSGGCNFCPECAYSKCD